MGVSGVGAEILACFRSIIKLVWITEKSVILLIIWGHIPRRLIQRFTAKKHFLSQSLLPSETAPGMSATLLSRFQFPGSWINWLLSEAMRLRIVYFLEGSLASLCIWFLLFSPSYLTPRILYSLHHPFSPLLLSFLSSFSFLSTSPFSILQSFHWDWHSLFHSCFPPPLPSLSHSSSSPWTTRGLCPNWDWIQSARNLTV